MVVGRPQAVLAGRRDSLQGPQTRGALALRRNLAKDAVLLDDGFDGVGAACDTGPGLLARHLGAGDTETHGLACVHGQVGQLAGAFAGDEDIVPRFALDDGAHAHDGVDVVALQKQCGGQRDVVGAGDVDVVLALVAEHFTGAR